MDKIKPDGFGMILIVIPMLQFCVLVTKENTGSWNGSGIGLLKS
jgi:hypothetical protein